jgi:hypothetical protein
MTGDEDTDAQGQEEKKPVYNKPKAPQAPIAPKKEIVYITSEQKDELLALNAMLGRDAKQTNDFIVENCKVESIDKMTTELADRIIERSKKAVSDKAKEKVADQPETEKPAVPQFQTSKVYTPQAVTARDEDDQSLKPLNEMSPEEMDQEVTDFVKDLPEDLN